MLSASTIELLVEGVEAAIQDAPEIEALVSSTVTYFENLFKAGVISADTQNQLAAHVNAVATATASGSPLPEFVVAPDPAS